MNCYSDAGISGASLFRPGIQALIKDALEGEFDVVLCEAMDRLSRDQEDIAGFYKRMEFAGTKIITLSEGEVNAMHIRRSCWNFSYSNGGKDYEGSCRR